jgi:hypothetical protein
LLFLIPVEREVPIGLVALFRARAKNPGHDQQKDQWNAQVETVFREEINELAHVVLLMMLSVGFSAALVRIAAKTTVGSSLLGPQAAPAIGTDLAINQLAGIRLGNEIRASAALLLAFRLSLVLHACLRHFSGLRRSGRLCADSWRTGRFSASLIRAFL